MYMNYCIIALIIDYSYVMYALPKRKSKLYLCSDVIVLTDCYTDDCVLDLLWCAQEKAEARSDILQCQLHHKICLAKCMGETLTDILS